MCDSFQFTLLFSWALGSAQQTVLFTFSVPRLFSFHEKNQLSLFGERGNPSDPHCTQPQCHKLRMPQSYRK